MGNVLKWVWRDVLKNRLQTILIIILILAAAFIYFFIRYASDGIAAEYNSFIEEQHQEQFEFTLNLAGALTKDQQWELLSGTGVSRQEFDLMGFNNIRKKYRLAFEAEESKEAERLSKEYHFTYERNSYKEIRQDGTTFRLIASPNSQSINQVYMSEGRLPGKSGEIAVPVNAEELLSSHIGGTISLGGNNYTVVGHFIEPGHLTRVSSGSEQLVSILSWPDDYKRSASSEQYLYTGRFLPMEGLSLSDETARMNEDTGFDTILQVNDNPNASEIIQGVTSNQGLSYTFLVVLGALCGGIYYVFLDRRLNALRQSWGVLQAMGYSPGLIIRAFLLVHTSLCAAGILAGWGLAYMGADLLIAQFQSQYTLPSFPKSVSTASLLIGIIFILAAFVLPLYLKLRLFARQTSLSMLQPTLQSSPKKVMQKLASWTEKFPFLSRIKWRMAFRSFRVIVLLVITIMLSSILFLLGFSLNQSSSDSVQRQFSGIHYSYDLRFDQAGIEEQRGDSDSYYRLGNKHFTWADSGSGRQGFQGELLSWDGDAGWLTLLSKDGQSTNSALDQGAVVHYSKAKLWGLRVGTAITVRVDNSVLQVPVSAFSYNGNPDTVYLKKDKLTAMLGISPHIYNGRFSNTSISEGDKGAGIEVISVKQIHDEKLSQASSSQLSAVLNQVIGVLIAILMIMLIGLIVTEESKRSMVILQRMGYEPAEIKNMLINVYVPILLVAYIITLPLSWEVVTSILRSVSISTNDYIPFIYNIWILIGVIALIILIYYVVITISSNYVFKKSFGKSKALKY
ncbi:ABC transporter permease [Paenibacillus sp. HW567]|uniref:ABC transporter permease n=1 Tax=Paenibacillus sp. HW567 TaxID=1034769 RepID=UPI0003711910|nr:ABC transporter permease [Paenibacillus sp. HW567]